MKKIGDYKLNFLYVIVSIVLILYCFFFVQELKWKLLLLSQSGMLLIRAAFEWLEVAGIDNYARALKNIYGVLSKILLVICMVGLLGSLLGVFDL